MTPRLALQSRPIARPDRVEPESFVGQSEADLRACAATEVERYTAITVSVDGQAISDIVTYRAATPLFTISLPPNNVFAVPTSVSSAIADGHEVMLAPLPAGDHEIVVHLELTDGTVLPDKVLSVRIRRPVDMELVGTPAAESLLATRLVPLIAAP